MDIIHSEVASEKAYPSQAQAWGIFGLLLLSSVLTYPLVDRMEEVGPSLIPWSDKQWEAVRGLISYLFSVGLVLAFAVYQKRRVEKSNFKLSFKPISWTYYVCLFFIILFYSYLLEPILELIPMSESFKKMFESFFDNTWITAFTVSLLAPVMEELLFRGVMLDGFLKHYSPLKAILLSSFFFGLVHLNPWQFIGAFGLGCLAGWLYWKTKSLWPCLFIHFVNNSLFTLFSYWADGNEAKTRALINHELIYWSFIGACFLFLTGLVYLVKRLPDANRE